MMRLSQTTSEIPGRYRNTKKPQDPPENEAPRLHAEITRVTRQVEQLRTDSTPPVADDGPAEKQREAKPRRQTNHENTYGDSSQHNPSSLRRGLRSNAVLEVPRLRIEDRHWRSAGIVRKVRSNVVHDDSS